MSCILLADRALLRIWGADALSFLQGLTSNNINALTCDNTLYSLILTPTGRFLFELFIVKDSPDSLLLDHHAGLTEELISFLISFKFRMKVNFEHDKALVVVATEDGAEGALPDPRSTSFGYRAITTSYEHCDNSDKARAQYHKKRISLVIPDGEMDMIRGTSMPLDYGIDRLNGISFNKGCYCGQEAISKARNIIGRQRDLFIIKSEHALPSKGADISLDGTSIGKTCGSIDNIGLGVFKIRSIQFDSNKTTIEAMAGGIPLTIYPH